MDSNKIEKLKQLSKLYKDGILTKEELELEKKKVLGENTSSIMETNLIKEKEPVKPIEDEEPKITYNVKKIGTDPNSDKHGITPNKKKVIYFIAAILILIGVGVFFGIYQHHQSVIAQQKEQARLDSIAEVERLREIRRRDSIAEVRRLLEIQRQDSIAKIKAMKISPEKLLKFKTYKDGEKYFLITDNLENYLQSIGYDLINKSTYYSEEGTDGTGPLTKHIKYVYKKGNSVVEYNSGDIQFTMQSEKDAEEFIEKCINMGFKFSHYGNQDSKIYRFPNAWGEIHQKGSEIIIGFAP